MEFDGVFDIAHLRCACGGGFDCDQVELHLSFERIFCQISICGPDECPALAEIERLFRRGEAVPPARLDLDEVEGAFSGSDDVQLVMSLPPVAVEQGESVVEKLPGGSLFALPPGMLCRGHRFVGGSCPVFSKYFFMTSSEMNRSRRLS